MEKKTILLVEDDALVKDVLRSAFEREYSVLEASGCSEAAELLRNPIDIAIIDYMLPDGDGFDVLKAIREVKPELPIIVMTAYSTEGVVIRALRAGVTEYVKKPLILASLRKKVSDILVGKRGEELNEYLIENNSREEFLLDGIAAFIENNYADDLTRDDLAERVGMNKYKFSKLFNDRFGETVKSYINKIRVKKAAELLGKHGLNIREIAFSVGFGSIEHFDRIFKEIHGISPKEYRMHQSKPSKQGSHLWHLD